MININTLRAYFRQNMVFVTEHAAERFRQRGIKIRDIRCAVDNGKIIEQYPHDFPFKSCLILGKDRQDVFMHVCMSDEGNMSKIVTAYYPDKNKWNSNFETRKENYL